MLNLSCLLINFVVSRPKLYVNRNIPTNAIMPVDEDAKEYNFNHSKRGVAIILNHTDYDVKMKLQHREGTDHDISRLNKTLKEKLQFDVRPYYNLTKSEIFTLLENGEYYCFIILLHGVHLI